MPTEETISLYVKRNGNQGEPTVTTLDREEKDGTSVEIRRRSKITFPKPLPSLYCLAGKSPVISEIRKVIQHSAQYS